MLLHLTNILSRDELAQARGLLGGRAPWIDGRSSAGGQELTQKQNHQLAQDSEVARRLQALALALALAAINRDPLFLSAALPKKIFNPLFNRYHGDSNFYGPHIDGAVLHSKATQQWVRTDISCTLFLSDPADYDDGELVIQDTQRIKLPAGHLILYPGTTIHQVTPVTRGERIASFFWIESLVRSDEQRRLLFDMDEHLSRLRQTLGEADRGLAGLTGTYHNLLRLWADT